MAKIILILLAVVVGIILAFSFVLGAARRLFGGAKRPQRSAKHEVVYEKGDVVVLRGESDSPASQP